MVLRFTVKNSRFLRDAVEAIPVDGLGTLMISWSPVYFGVESVLMIGETPISLLKLSPQSFTSFESTDTHFNASVDSEELRTVFRSAIDSDPIEFSESSDFSRVYPHGFLNVRFNRPINIGAPMNDIFSLKIHEVRSEDMPHHPSLNVPLDPVARVDASHFMVALRTSGTTAFITTQEGRQIEVMMTSPRERGVISTRREDDDGDIIETIRVPFDLQKLELEGDAALSNELALFKHGEEASLAMIWFRLDRTRTRLDGDIIHWLH